MKKIAIYSSVLVFILISLFNVTEVKGEYYQVVFFKEATCFSCQEVMGTINGVYNEDNDYIKKIEAEGIEVIVIDILPNADKPPVLPVNLIYGEDDVYSNNDIFTAFTKTYGISSSEATVPYLFVGETYYHDVDEITDAFDNGSIMLNAQKSLIDVDLDPGASWYNLRSFVGFILVLGAGLLDGFNPCAIALLLLFISLLGFTENKKVLILVSITYISALFISYFLIGVLLIDLINKYVRQIQTVNQIVSWGIFIVVSFLFLFNFYDYLVTKKEDYGKVKNQLPKWIQKMNKRIIKTFTKSMDSDSSIAAVVALTFILGVTMSITELACTGQIYFGVLDGISLFKDFYAYVALFFYNLMFVLPLIIIAVISIRARGIMSTSNWVREHMHTIKLLNSLLFLGIALYYVYRIFIAGL